MDVPSMVRRSGDTLIVRQVVSGQQEVFSERQIKTEVKLEQSVQPDESEGLQRTSESVTPAPSERDLRLRGSSWKRNGGREQLPQCKVKRNYSCPSCAYGTQNPRRYLTHLRDTHGEKISINECQRCLYASKHHQKLVRHMRMVHGIVDPGSRGPVKREDSSNDNTVSAEPEFSQPTSEFDTTTNTTSAVYGQQLVASDLQRLLKRFANSLNSSIAANAELFQNALKIEMDHLQNVLNAPDVDNIQTEQTVKHMSGSMEENESVPRKRARPIPNLIPLASPPTVAVRPEKDLLKPVPMALLMPQEGSECRQPSDNQTINQSPTIVPQMKCTFCELSYGTTSDLANHIEAAHKEDLFTSLLQRSLDDTQQNLFPQIEPDSASNEVWKSLLEVSYGGSESVSRAQANELEGRQPAQPTEADDDVEILETRTETYCGIETAPGYGEVTSKLPNNDPNAPNTVTKKVFKCPHCSFWASTASRFHVHIVGHLNKKPFECSLCSYRSNWRWDITKHIRLKTIRDPSHKNAGVLMNDETGRRNYTKYNKYITLMQIADNSAKDSATYAKSIAENTISDLVAACSTYNIDLKAFANIPGYKTLLANKQLGEEVPSGNDPSQHGAFPLKCHVCEFRTSSNEELLLHMTSSHAGPTIVQLDDVIETEPSGAPTVESTNATSQLRNCTLVNTVPSVTAVLPTATALCNLSKSSVNTSSGECSTNGTPLLTTSGAGERTNAPESQGPGEGEGGPQRMAVPAWRHNAPYRCGHCHQVSNWKHVIQRHCRLKHNGNVLIEHINSEKEDPSDGEGSLTQRSTKPNQHSLYDVEDGQHSHAASTADLTQQSSDSPNAPLPPLAPFNCDEQGYPVGNTLEPIVEIYDKDPADLISLGDSSTVLVSSGTVAPAVPGDLDCVSCQFRAETVEQLTEHLEAHISNGHREDSYNIAPTTLLDPVPTIMFYCYKCPARFFDRCHVEEHLERHSPAGDQGTVCPLCKYTSPTADEPNRHLEVHSASYNKNTDNLQIFLAESKDYPKPRLTMHETADQSVVWCVETPVPAPEEPPATSPKRSKRSKATDAPRGRSVDTASIGTDQPPLRSIFLCEYCDNAFDAESDLNDHVQSHFSAILAAQNVAYYASLNNALHKERKLELVVTGAQSTLPLHYAYDNAPSKEWAPYSKTESVMLKL